MTGGFEGFPKRQQMLKDACKILNLYPARYHGGILRGRLFRICWNVQEMENMSFLTASKTNLKFMISLNVHFQHCKKLVTVEEEVGKTLMTKRLTL